MKSFELLVFSLEQTLIEDCARSGLGTVVVDWEDAGKRERQAGADTEINAATAEDLRRISSIPKIKTICRINNIWPDAENEIEEAIENRASEILLPMVRDDETVTRALRLIRERVPLGILIETKEAVNCAAALCRLPISRVYVGLNDLAISKGHPHNIFLSLLDGTVERIRESCKEVKFGFGGLTVPGMGRPLPSELLMSEMVRLSCDFTFLRRSFWRDVKRIGIDESVSAIENGIEKARRYGRQRLALDREELHKAISQLTDLRAGEPVEAAAVS